MRVMRCAALAGAFSVGSALLPQGVHAAPIADSVAVVATAVGHVAEGLSVPSLLGVGLPVCGQYSWSMSAPGVAAGSALGGSAFAGPVQVSVSFSSCSSSSGWVWASLSGVDQFGLPLQCSADGPADGLVSVAMAGGEVLENGTCTQGAQSYPITMYSTVTQLPSGVPGTIGGSDVAVTLAMTFACATISPGPDLRPMAASPNALVSCT